MTNENILRTKGTDMQQSEKEESKFPWWVTTAILNLQTMDRLQGTQEQMEPVSKHTVQFSRERINSIHIFKGVCVAKEI